MREKTVVAIGGGELKKGETLPIDRKIVSLTKKRNPRALFIPTASNDALSYWSTFQNIYGKKLHCQPDRLFLVREKLNKKEIKQKIAQADLVYVGGGNTLKMMQMWRKNGVDDLLRRAYAQGTIMAGLSAGAICWFRYGLSDSNRFFEKGKPFELMRVSGLDLISCTVSPHHVREKSLRVAGIKKLMLRTPGIGLGIDDNAALLIQADHYEIISSGKNATVRKFFRRKNEIINSNVKSSGSLDSLLSKN